MALGVDSVIFIDGRVVMNTSVVVNKRRKYTCKSFDNKRIS